MSCVIEGSCLVLKPFLLGCSHKEHQFVAVEEKRWKLAAAERTLDRKKSESLEFDSQCVRDLCKVHQELSYSPFLKPRSNFRATQRRWSLSIPPGFSPRAVVQQGDLLALKYMGSLVKALKQLPASYNLITQIVVLLSIFRFSQCTFSIFLFPILTSFKRCAGAGGVRWTRRRFHLAWTIG